MLKPYRCPVCEGNGFVPNGFYNQVSGQWSTSSLAPEICRSCQGTGYVVVDDGTGENTNKEVSQ
jgi:DnaJ-class molecular chaperone